MSLIHPYLKHTTLLIVLIFAFVLGIIVIRKAFKDDKFRAWLMASLSVDNNVTKGSSGKSLSGFLFCLIIALASLVSFIWTPTHLMPEYMYISLLSFIAALYSIKLVGGRFGNANGNGSGNDTSSNNNITGVTGATGVTGSTGSTGDIG